MLIRDIETFKRHLGGIDRDLSWQTVYSYLEEAELLHLIPAIGQELYDELDTAFDLTKPAPFGLTENQVKLMMLLQKALAPYGLLQAIPFLNLRMGDGGIQQSSGNGQAPASQWAVNKADMKLAETADLMLERALQFLEANADEFDTWKGSAAYTVDYSHLVPSATVFSKFVNIGQSRRTYKSLQSAIAKVEDTMVRKALGGELYSLLLAQIQAPALEDKWAEPMRLAQAAVANLAMAQGAHTLGLKISGDGIRVLQSMDGIHQLMAVSDKVLLGLKASHDTDGKSYLADLVSYFKAHAEDFPEYQEESTTAKVNSLPDNCGFGHFMM